MSSPSVQQYFDRLESRIGYRLMLGGRRHFGFYAEGSWWPFPLTRALRAMEDQLFSVLDLPAGARVLDAGCGDCQVAMHMASKGLEIEAVDLIDRHVKRARENVQARKLEGAVHVSKMNYQDLSFDDASFDGVFTLETLSLASDYRQAIKEFHRVLKPDGSLALFEYEHADLGPGAAKKAISLVNKYSSMSAFEDWTTGTIGKELDAAGFKDIEVRDYTQNVAPLMRLFALVAWIPYLLISLMGWQAYFQTRRRQRNCGATASTSSMSPSVLGNVDTVVRLLQMRIEASARYYSDAQRYVITERMLIERVIKS